MPPSSNLGYDIKQAKDRADYCKDVKRVSDKKIHETEVLEKQRAERLQAIKEEQMRNELRHRQEEVKE